jgi:quercetin dioxygenase-like cupin family protein
MIIRDSDQEEDMAITVVRPEDRRPAPVESNNPAPQAAKDASLKQVLSNDEPYVQLTVVKPGTTLPVHSHAEPEAMIVLSGTVEVAGVWCPAGTIAIIPADEKYGLQVGDDEPLAFVVVRPHPAEIKPT